MESRKEPTYDLIFSAIFACIGALQISENILLQGSLFLVCAGVYMISAIRKL